MTVRPLRLSPELDAFVVTDEFKYLAARLGIVEWHELVWMGRLLISDNDYGEHLFDNWAEREQREAKAKELAIESRELMTVAPFRFKNDRRSGKNRIAAQS